jgi:hypothetical protein
MLEQPNEISVLEKLRDDLDSLRERLDEAHQIYYSKISPGEINEAYSTNGMISEIVNIFNAVEELTKQ